MKLTHQLKFTISVEEQICDGKKLKLDFFPSIDFIKEFENYCNKHRLEIDSLDNPKDVLLKDSNIKNLSTSLKYSGNSDQAAKKSKKLLKEFEKYGYIILDIKIISI